MGWSGCSSRAAPISLTVSLKPTTLAANQTHCVQCCHSYFDSKQHEETGEPRRESRHEQCRSISAGTSIRT